MLNWFKKKRPLPQTGPHEEAAAPQVDETGQDIVAGEDAASRLTTPAPEAAMGVDEATIPTSPPLPETANGAHVQPPLPLEELPLEELSLEELPLEEFLIEEIEEKTLAAEDVQPLAATNEQISAPPSEKSPLFAAPPKKPAPKTGLFSRLAERLSRTRESFTNQLDQLLYGRKEIDRNLFDQLEELLITADLGYATSQEILDAARQRVKHEDTDNPQALREAIRDKMLDYLTRVEQDASLSHPPSDGPFVIMVIGVNGVGKTTTIGKIAHKFTNSGHTVLLVAADTFRAAAISQLKIWGERGGIHVMAKESGSDPSAVVFDAMAHATAKNYDVVLVDTAGRLHTERHLMEELKKIKRVMGKKLPGAPHEVLLVLDATTGQNAIAQARLFNDAVRVTGLALTKLDGTAKGGIVINVTKELGVPIRFIGVGEQLDDLRDFDAREFIDALFDGGSGRKS